MDRGTWQATVQRVDFPGGSVVKNLPAVQETWFQSLGQEDLLEKEIATHSSTLAWRTPWTEEPAGLQSIGLQRVERNYNDLAQHPAHVICRKI